MEEGGESTLNRAGGGGRAKAKADRLMTPGLSLATAPAVPLQPKRMRVPIAVVLVQVPRRLRCDHNGLHGLRHGPAPLTRASPGQKGPPGDR